MKIYLKKTLSVLFAILMVVTMFPVTTFAADETDTSDGVPLTIDVTDETDVLIGNGYDYYDEDGYILTGTNEECSIYVYEESGLTLNNLTANLLSFSYAPQASVMNITLDGATVLTYAIEMKGQHLIFNGDEEDTFNVPCFEDDSEDGTVTVNGGDIVLSVDDYYPIGVSGGFTINGGTVTASSGCDYMIFSPVVLNGGVLNVIHYQSDYPAFGYNVTMKNGALLTVSTEGKIIGNTEEILLDDDAAESDYFFVRYDKESDFVPVLDIKAALEGKTYAEITVDTHNHIYGEDEKCQCGAVHPDAPLTIDVSEIDSSYISLGSEYDYYDKDGYILTGTNEDLYIDIYDECDLTLSNLTVKRFYPNNPADTVMNITLDGTNEIIDHLSFLNGDLVFEGDDDDTLKVPRLAADGSTGTATVNGGNIIVESITSSETPTITCKLIINGGTVTASNNYSWIVQSLVTLNGGVFNVISTSTRTSPVHNKITMKKGSVLTISSAYKSADKLSTVYKFFSSIGSIAMADDAGENDYFFVRYDKESDFVLVSDINSALEGKAYAEVKVVEHTHLFESGSCDCGYICSHTDMADNKCEECGSEFVKLTIEMKDEYGNGWSSSALVIEQMLENGEIKEIAAATLDNGKSDTFETLIPADAVFLLFWDSDSSYDDECSFTVYLDGEVFLSVSDVRKLAEPIIICPHICEDGICERCGDECGVDFEHKASEDGICKYCGKFIYMITHQPTESEPYVELNKNETLTYQWYTVTDKELTDESEKISGDWTEVDLPIENTVYVDGVGWVADTYKEYGVYQYYFKIDLKAGESVKFEFSSPVTMFAFKAGIGGESTDDYYYPQSTEYTVTAKEDGVHYLTLAGEIDYVRVYEGEPLYTPVEAETSAKLSKLEYGKKYACKISCPDGQTVVSDVIDRSYRITHQPTEAEPYVELNNDTDAKYQWYSKKTEYIEFTDENVTADLSSIGVPDDYQAPYNAETGWSGETGFYFALELKEGDLVDVVLSEETEYIDVMCVTSKYQDIYPLYTADGINATLVAQADGFYGFGSSTDDPTTLCIKAYGNVETVSVIEGETEAELKNPVYGAENYCEVTFKDGTTEKSASADFSYKITHQPTDAEPYVELNNDTDAKYQWYNVIAEPVLVSPENAYGNWVNMGAPFENSVYKDGKWTATDYEGVKYYFIMELKAGDTVNFDFGSKATRQIMFSGNPAVTSDRYYSETVQEDGEYYLVVYGQADYVKATVGELECVPVEGETEAELKNPVYGKKYACEVTFANGIKEKTQTADLTYKITHQPTAAEPYIELNSNDGAVYKWYEIYYEEEAVNSENASAYTPDTFIHGDESYNAQASTVDEDGWWTPIYYESSYEDKSWYSEGYLVVHLNKGDKIEFEFENAENLREIYIGLVDGDGTSDLELTNGNTAEYTALADGDYFVSATEYINEDGPSRLKATVTGKKSRELTSETEKTLKSPEFGKEYFCEITAKDGTELTHYSFVYKPSITSQPAEGEPSVEINDENATYQWYTVSGEITEITESKANAVDYSDGDYADTFVVPSSYFSEENVWSPAYAVYNGLYSMEFFSAEFKAGDKLEVELSDASLEVVIYTKPEGDMDSEIVLQPVSVEGNKATFIIEEDGTYCFYAKAEKHLTAKVSLDEREYTPVPGATSSTFDAAESGNYSCEVTFKDGSKEMSAPVAVHVHTPKAAVEENVVPAKCEVPGSYELVVYCSECDEEISRAAKTTDALEHKFTSYVQTVPPTCTTSGKKVASCDNNCGKTDEQTVAATNHAGTLVAVDAKASTCKETGYGAYEYCTACTYSTKVVKGTVDHADTNGDYKCDYNCGYEFEKPTEPTTEPTTNPSVEDTTKPSTEPTTNPSEPTTKPTEPTTNPSEPTTKPAEPTTKPTEPVTEHKHTEVVVKGKAATCTEKGLTDGKKCSDCGEITVAQKEISATGHKEVTIKAVAATYKKSGKTEGKKCSVCGTITSAQRKTARKKLKKVKNLKVKKATTTTVKLSWKKVTGAEKYKVYYSTNGKKWKSKTTTKTSITIKKLKSGKQYRFKVKAVAGNYSGTASKVVKKTTKVKKVTISSLKSAKKKQATLKWKKVTNASGYVIEYSTSKKFTKKTTKTVKIKKGKTVKTTLKKLKSGKKYYVRIRAYKTVNKKAVYGAYSKVKTVKVK